MSWFQRTFRSKKRKKEIRKQHADSLGTYVGLTQEQIDAQFKKDEATLRHENQRKQRIGVAVIAATAVTAGALGPGGAAAMAATTSKVGAVIGTAAKVGGVVAGGVNAFKKVKGAVQGVNGNTGIAGAAGVTTGASVPSGGNGNLPLIALGLFAAKVLLK